MPDESLFRDLIIMRKHIKKDHQVGSGKKTNKILISHDLMCDQDFYII